MNSFNIQRYLIAIHHMLLLSLQKALLSNWQDGLTLDNEASYIAYLEGK